MSADVRVTTSVVAEVEGDGAEQAYLALKATLQQEANLIDLTCDDQSRTCRFSVLTVMTDNS